MTRTLLEIIALDALDAEAAEAGGADRLEVVSDMSADGLTPDVATIERIRAVTSLPLRVMLRSRPGFETDAADLASLAGQAARLAGAGADGFVFGFLTGDGRVDVAATARLAGALDGLPWTFHRAIDHAADTDAAWGELLGLPGLDMVLTSGSPAGLSAGLSDVLSRPAELVLAGGGLVPEYVPRLKAAGVRAFHVGSAAREPGGWQAPVSADRVAAWREIVG
ncbi:copper homeostasis protein CutC [Longispora albida]|uniref:copper homeostasis protein CutC n=1 Tax=Longispora albida TaxID=203523 RepID=UPI000362F0BE|nr:copper homeostasis protein CutC [Longispora albida]